MGQIHVHEFVSLDGNMDAPSWTFEYGFDPKMGEAIGAVSGRSTAILLGRETYQMFEPAWSTRTVEDDPGAPFFNDTTKYVVSSTLTEGTWRNSEILGAYDADRIRRLKDEVDGDLYISGSGQLVRALLADGLIDGLHLFVYPLTLGPGPRVFDENVPGQALARGEPDLRQRRRLPALSSGVVKFGLYGLHKGENTAPEALARRARAAEDAGFESLWVGDHIALPPDAPDDAFDPRLEAVVTLAHLAAVTSRVRLGLGVIILPQRQPVLLAKQLTSVDVLSGGRLMVGLGVGYLEAELGALGATLAERGARMDESIAAMQMLWDEPRRSSRAASCLRRRLPAAAARRSARIRRS